MAGNTDPIYSRLGNCANNYNSTTPSSSTMAPTITAAAADFTGVSANNTLVFTADANNGSFVQRLRFKANGTNAVTCARIYVNNGSANTTATNNSFYDEISLPATTTTTTSTVSSPTIDLQMNFALPPGFRIYVGLSALVAGGWTVTTIAGNY